MRAGLRPHRYVSPAPERRRALRPPLPRPHGKIVPGIAITTALGVLALVAWLLWPARSHSQAIPYIPQIRARSYTAYTACLLTDQNGTGSPQAAAVWAGLRAASNATDAQISFLAMQGPDTSANADAYINTLALRGCALILAVGQTPVQGARDRAAAFPDLRFVIVAVATATPSASAGAKSNLTSVATADLSAVPAEIRDEVARAAASQGTDSR